MCLDRIREFPGENQRVCQNGFALINIISACFVVFPLSYLDIDRANDNIRTGNYSHVILFLLIRAL